jgi:hypothetical protein
VWDRNSQINSRESKSTGRESQPKRESVKRENQSRERVRLIGKLQ